MVLKLGKQKKNHHTKHPVLYDKLIFNCPTFEAHRIRIAGLTVGNDLKILPINIPVLAVDGIAVSWCVYHRETELHASLLDFYRRRLNLNRSLYLLWGRNKTNKT